MELYLVSVGIQVSGNLGALARLCDNFAVKELILINPECEIDRDAYIRSTKGKHYLENVIVSNDFKIVKEKTDIIVGLSARKGGIENLARPAISIQEFRAKLQGGNTRIAIVVGRESSGLTNIEVGECDILTHIPIATKNPILNISHAAGIALWELSKHDNYSSLKEETFRLMHRGEKQAFLLYLEEILEHSWIGKDKKESTIRIFNNILTRSIVTHREGPALVGTLRSIHKSLLQGHPPWDKCDDK